MTRFCRARKKDKIFISFLFREVRFILDIKIIVGNISVNLISNESETNITVIMWQQSGFQLVITAILSHTKSVP